MKDSAHLILSVDYEIFGDGSGDIDCCIVDPAWRMMAIADRFHAPVTFFVEVLELLALEQVTETKKGIKIIREQLINAINIGHDAQLHLHPQWTRVNNFNNHWRVDMERWRIGDMEEDEIAEMIQCGKSWLEKLLQSVDQSYCCNTFRAGGWCIQPSTTVIKGMLNEGIVIDSTVAPGFRNSNKGEWCDFSNAPDKPYWRAKSDICTSENQGIWEAPIATGKVGRWRHLQAIKSSRMMDNHGLALGCSGSYRGPGGKLQAIYGKVGKLFRLGDVMLDFSTMPADVLIDITSQWLTRYDNSDLTVLPVVAIAHTKNFTMASAGAFHSYLQWADSQNIQFSTYGQWLEAVNAHNA